MTRRPAPRTLRPVTGIVVLAFALFFAAGLRCGLVGRTIVQVSEQLIGAGGRALVLCTLLAVAYVCLVPAGTFGRLLAALRTPPTPRTRRRTIDVVEVDDAPPALPPAHRRHLDDVRGALKGLGYKATEYEHVVAAMDPTLPLERLVRDGLRALQRSGTAS